MTRSSVQIVTKPVAIKATLVYLTDWAQEEIWVCEHMHPTHEEAEKCAGVQIAHMAEMAKP